MTNPKGGFDLESFFDTEINAQDYSRVYALGFFSK